MKALRAVVNVAPAATQPPQETKERRNDHDLRPQKRRKMTPQDKETYCGVGLRPTHKECSGGAHETWRMGGVDVPSALFRSAPDCVTWLGQSCQTSLIRRASNPSLV